MFARRRPGRDVEARARVAVVGRALLPHPSVGEIDRSADTLVVEDRQLELRVDNAALGGDLVLTSRERLVVRHALAARQ